MSALLPLPVSRCIDASLARSIRRGYFRRLAREWRAYEQRRTRAAARNVRLGGCTENRKQFRDKLALLERFAGPLLPACTLRMETGSRALAMVWALYPQEVPAAVQTDSHSDVRALVLLQPGYWGEVNLAVRIRAHAVDRVIQRAKVVDLPVADVDMQAINAEFSDLLPIACVAADVLANRQGEPLQVLLPAKHGVFLVGWNAEDRRLEVRTFVDHSKLNAAQHEAVREIRRLSEHGICAEAVSAVAPGWMWPYRPGLGCQSGGVGACGLRERLVQAWEHFGWRFEEDRLHPGLSDQAWRSEALVPHLDVNSTLRT